MNDMLQCAMRALGENVMTLWPSSRSAAAILMSSFKDAVLATLRNACKFQAAFSSAAVASKDTVGIRERRNFHVKV